MYPSLKYILLSCYTTCLLLACSTPEEVQPKAGAPAQEEEGTTNNPPSGNGGNLGYTQDDLSDITVGFSELMEALDMQGAQVAITYNEQLVYLQSFGTADVANGIAVNNRSLFRIASISKPVTLLAISRLASGGKLSLSDLVFGANGILGTQYGTPPYESFVETITVGHLVEHTSGFINDPYDIMFDDNSLSHADLIGKVLDTRSLAYQPGTNYNYSNFGYSLLGRIIEKVSGMSYEKYVMDHILSPMDIRDMRLAGNTKIDAFPNEVSYYSGWVSPYSMNVARMDSHGGWLASAGSLAYLAVQVDNMNVIPNFLSKGEGVSYLEGGHWNHNGALPGTLGVLQVGSPVSYVILMNNGDADYQEIIQVVRNFINQKTQGRKSWPKIDLFNPL